MSYRVVVLGGYGTFGRRICRALAIDGSIHVIVAGRRGESARQYTKTLQQASPHVRVSAASLDIDEPDFVRRLQQLRPATVIHTCGPFQTRDYRVARACIASAAHYIDLADARSFVTGFTALNEAARQQNVLAVSGASSVPALSAAVVDALLPGFKQLHSIDHGINPGNRTPRGLATVRSILSYCGKPFSMWRNNAWETVYGWQGLHRRLYPAPMGRRWLGHCNVPDLELFQKRYPGVSEVRFSAGLELPVLHLGTWLLSWPARLGLVADWGRYAAPLKRISEWFEKLGSTRGGMHVQLDGLDHQGVQKRLIWYLLADNNDGPQIPCTAAVVVARKLAHGKLKKRGAMPCLSLFTLAEFIQELNGLEVQQRLEFFSGRSTRKISRLHIHRNNEQTRTNLPL